MLQASDIRVGHVLDLSGKLCKVLTQDVKGTGKFSKHVHVKLKDLEDGSMAEKSFRADESVADVEVRTIKMQYSYKDGESFVFMDTESYEEYRMSASVVGQHEVFLAEGEEIDVLWGAERILSIDFPKTAELKVSVAPPGIKGGSDSTYKEVELENGLKVLTPQFIKEGDLIKVNIEDLSYAERMTHKNLGRGD